MSSRCQGIRPIGYQDRPGQDANDYQAETRAYDWNWKIGALARQFADTDVKPNINKTTNKLADDKRII